MYFLDVLFFFLFELYGDHRDLHVLTHSFPTRRSSDLLAIASRSSVRARRTYMTTNTGNMRSVSSVGHCSRIPNITSMKPRYCGRSEEHTSELQSLMRISYAVFCLKKKTNKHNTARKMLQTNTTPNTQQTKSQNK